MKTIARITVQGSQVSLKEDGSWVSKDASIQQMVRSRFPAELFGASPREPFQRFEQAKSAADFYESAVSFFGVSPDIADRVY